MANMELQAPDRERRKKKNEKKTEHPKTVGQYQKVEHMSN